MKITLDEAIVHLEELLKANDFVCDKCRDEHIQLLEWLNELRELRKIKSVTNTPNT